MIDETDMVALYRPCSECNGSGKGDIKHLLPVEDEKAVARYMYVCGVCMGKAFHQRLVKLSDLLTASV